jgi:uncharacterized membrane protein YphA (DoxX/SURF4 family)
MKILMIVLRTLMGALFIFGAVLFFFHLYPKQPELKGAAKTFNDGLTASVYLMPLIKAVELICGILFVIGRFVPLATVMIFPIVVNIVMYHTFLGQAELPVAIVLLAINLFLAFYYRKNYIGLLAAKA